MVFLFVLYHVNELKIKSQFVYIDFHAVLSCTCQMNALSTHTVTVMVLFILFSIFWCITDPFVLKKTAK